MTQDSVVVTQADRDFASRWASLPQEHGLIANDAARHCLTSTAELTARVAEQDAEIARLREALHAIDVEAFNTIPPDGKDAAFAALDRIIRIINPFRLKENDRG